MSKEDFISSLVEEREAVLAFLETDDWTLDDTIAVCHNASYCSGWWHNIDTDFSFKHDRNRPEMLALIHSEISEALEGERKNLMDDKLIHRPAAEVELADAVIRIFDYAAGFKYDLVGAIAEKIKYNMSRKDHTIEARLANGGKKF